MLYFVKESILTKDYRPLWMQPILFYIGVEGNIHHESVRFVYRWVGSLAQKMFGQEIEAITIT